MTTKNITTFGAYQPIYRAGSYYFVSGQVGVDPATKLAPSALADQVDQAINNLKNVLHQHKLNLNNVVKTTLYLVDIEDFTEVNNVYSSYFIDPKPARSTVAVKDLPKVGGQNRILFEIEAIAYKRED